MRALVVLAALLTLIASPPAAEQGNYLDWRELVDASAQSFDDPFRDLSPDNLSDLVTLVRLQERLERGATEEALRPRLEARIAQKEAALDAAGIDVPWLIEQRWVVAEKRQQAALAVNATLDGDQVEIGGFLIPAPPTEDGRPTAYLVPERGMCSHMPPPPPNQLLRLITSDMPEIARIYEPVIVRGRLAAHETNREIFVVDGPVPMWSAWTVEAAELELIHGRSLSR